MSTVPPPPPFDPPAVTITEPDGPTAPDGGAPADPPRSGGKSLALALLVGAAGLAVGVVMTILWLGAQSERDDAVDERDRLAAESDQAGDEVQRLQSELQTADDDLAVATAEVERLQAQLDDERATASSDAARVAELEAEVEELTGRVDDLTAENDELREALEAAESATPEAPETPEAPDGADASFDVADVPEFARYVGELLSSRTGSSRLSVEQSTCFGGAVIDRIGLDALGAGLHNARTSEANDAVVAAMQQAADSCGVDAALIFG